MSDKITGQKVERITRQSEGYYIYLMNGVIILALKCAGKFLMTPPKYAGPMETIQGKNLMDAIRNYIKKYNLIQ